jgi:hypothetical protein
MARLLKIQAVRLFLGSWYECLPKVVSHDLKALAGVLALPHL